MELIGITAIIFLAVGALTVQYRHGKLLAAMKDASQLIGAVSNVMDEIQKALADDKITPEEVKAIAGKLEKFQPLMTEIQRILTGENKDGAG